jgi:hypothetical protein
MAPLNITLAPLGLNGTLIANGQALQPVIAECSYKLSMHKPAPLLWVLVVSLNFALECMLLLFVLHHYWGADRSDMSKVEFYIGQGRKKDEATDAAAKLV